MRIFNYKMLIVITFLTGSYFSCTNSIQNTNERKTEVDEYVNQVLERYGIPGAALAIIKDGKIQLTLEILLMLLHLQLSFTIAVEKRARSRCSTTVVPPGNFVSQAHRLARGPSQLPVAVRGWTVRAARSQSCQTRIRRLRAF